MSSRRWPVHRFLTAARPLCIGLAVLLCLVCLPACQGTSFCVLKEDYAMATRVTLRLFGKQSEEMESAATELLREVHALEGKLSWRLDSSETAQVNAAAGSNQPVLAPEAAGILRRVLPVGEQSGWLFNPAVGPLTRLWDIGGEQQRLPGGDEIAAVLPLCRVDGVAVDGDEVELLFPQMALDLGAVGKGAACDLLRRGFQERNIEAAVATVGGSVVTYGKKPDGGSWSVAVRDPADSAETLGTILVEGTAFLSTSGDYERYFEQDGVRYHHLLNPFTGYPGSSGLTSVTVLCDNGAVADALSTAAFLLGAEDGKKLLGTFGAEGIFVAQDGQIFLTQGMAERFELKAGSGYRVAA